MGRGVSASVQDARPISLGTTRGCDLDRSRLSGHNESSIVVVNDGIKGSSESVQIERYFTIEEYVECNDARVAFESGTYLLSTVNISFNDSSRQLTPVIACSNSSGFRGHMMKRGFACRTRAIRDEGDLRSVANSVTILLIAGDVSRQHAMGLA